MLHGASHVASRWRTSVVCGIEIRLRLWALLVVCGTLTLKLCGLRCHSRSRGCSCYVTVDETWAASMKLLLDHGLKLRPEELLGPPELGHDAA
jgi:hypothetical protein